MTSSVSILYSPIWSGTSKWSRDPTSLSFKPLQTIWLQNERDRVPRESMSFEIWIKKTSKPQWEKYSSFRFNLKTGRVVLAFDSSTWKAKALSSLSPWVQGQHGLCSEFQCGQDYIKRLCLQKKKIIFKIIVNWRLVRSSFHVCMYGSLVKKKKKHRIEV